MLQVVVDVDEDTLQESIEVNEPSFAEEQLTPLNLFCDELLREDMTQHNTQHVFHYACMSVVCLHSGVISL